MSRPAGHGQPPAYPYQAGLAVVELAAIGFVLAILMSGILTLGVRFYQKNSLIKAVQDASRYYAMNCANDSAAHTDSSSITYNNAINIIFANIEQFKVTASNAAITRNYVQARTRVRGGNAFDATTGLLLTHNSCTGINAVNACNSACNYVEFSIPAPGATLVLGDWTIDDQHPIRAVNRIMR